MRSPLGSGSQNEQLLDLSRQILELTKAVHAHAEKRPAEQPKS